MDTIKPGRELDTFIAEQIIGLRIRPDGECVWPNGEISPVLNYSTSLSDAYTVLERLYEIGKYVDYNFYNYEGTNGWTFELNKKDASAYPDELIEVSSHSLAHAICLGAVKANEFSRNE